jgi:nucleoside-diphosphate-sugar epimerase
MFSRPVPTPRSPSARPIAPDGPILVTGASGLIGGVLLADLAQSHQVRGLDIRPGERTDVIADLRSDALPPGAFDGIDTVIDLAANSDADASWEEVRTNNIPATINSFEAARCAGVRRIVFASSNHVIGLAEHDEPYASILAGRYDGLDPEAIPRLTTTAPARPDGPYGVGKVLGEALGRYCSERYGLSVLCLRIGTVSAPDRPTNSRHFSTLLSQRDLVQLVRCCIEAPDSLRFGVYFGVSANRWRIWDIENARAELGYVPRDDAESWR